MGGQLTTYENLAVIIAYRTTVTTTGFVGGAITNRLGTRATLLLGCMGYPVVISAYLCYLYTYNIGFVIFSGALLGCCSGVVWSALGQIVLSYPREAYKGRYVAFFFAIYRITDVVGYLVSCAAMRKVNIKTDRLVSFSSLDMRHKIHG